MSRELMEEFIAHADALVDDIDSRDCVEFEREGILCSVESVSEETIKLTIDGDVLKTDDIVEAIQFFDSSFDADERERAINELEEELRSTFGR